MANLPEQPAMLILSAKVYQIIEMMKALIHGESKFEFWGLDDSLTGRLMLECVEVPERPRPISVEARIKTNVIVLMSGGLDSTIAYYMLAQQYGVNRVGGLFLDIGQPYVAKEGEAVRSLEGVKPLHEFLFCDMLDVGKIVPTETVVDWKHIIPLRNWLFIEMAACYASDAVAFSVLRGERPDSGGDKSRTFTIAIARHLQIDYRLELLLPLANMTKGDAVSWFLNSCMIGDRAWREAQLRKTVTCFDVDDGHCGCCQACLRRYMAGKTAGIDFDFKVNPLEGAMQYAEKYRHLMSRALRERDFSHYDERRCRQDLAVLLPRAEYDKLMGGIE